MQNLPVSLANGKKHFTWIAFDNFSQLSNPTRSSLGNAWTLAILLQGLSKLSDLKTLARLKFNAKNSLHSAPSPRAYLNHPSKQSLCNNGPKRTSVPYSISSWFEDRPFPSIRYPGEESSPRGRSQSIQASRARELTRKCSRMERADSAVRGSREPRIKLGSRTTSTRARWKALYPRARRVSPVLMPSYRRPCPMSHSNSDNARRDNARPHSPRANLESICNLGQPASPEEESARSIYNRGPTAANHRLFNSLRTPSARSGPTLNLPPIFRGHPRITAYSAEIRACSWPRGSLYHAPIFD